MKELKGECNKCGKYINNILLSYSCGLGLGIMCMECFNKDSCIGNENLYIDNIRTPKHYTQGGIEPIDFSISNNLDFCEGNIVKYITRYKYKNGLEDLKKCQFYINKIIDEYGDENT